MSVLLLAFALAQAPDCGKLFAAGLQALQIEPKNVLALPAASNLYLQNGLHIKALPLLERLATVTPGQACSQ